MKICYCLVCGESTYGDEIDQVVCLATGTPILVGTTHSLQNKEEPEWCPLPPNERILTPDKIRHIPRQPKVAKKEEYDCFGVKYSSMVKCGQCPRLEPCGTVWSGKAWQTHRKGGFGGVRKGISGNWDGSWDNVVNIDEEHV